MNPHSFRINRRIRAQQVLVIDNEGKKLGIMVPEEALRLAREAGLDLVEISPRENPPVCKIMDFGKFLYKLSKKEKAQKKKTGGQLKEMRLSIKISDHDYEFKMKHIRKFLQNGDKVKVTLFFRGREIVHADRAKAIFDRLIEDTKDVGKPETEISRTGRIMSLVIAPTGKKKE